MPHSLGALLKGIATVREEAMSLKLFARSAAEESRDMIEEGFASLRFKREDERSKASLQEFELRQQVKANQKWHNEELDRLKLKLR